MLRYRTVAILVILAACVCPGTSSSSVRHELAEFNFHLYSAPSPANDMALKDLDGKPLNLADLRNKVVILNFWRIECPPCAREKPILERLHRAYSSRGLAIVAVNLFDSPEQQRSYVRSRGYTFLFAHDPDKAFSVRTTRLPSGTSTGFVVNSSSDAIYELPGVPTSYVIDRQGRVVGNSVGLTNWGKRPLALFIEELLDSPPRVGNQDSGMGNLFATPAGQYDGSVPEARARTMLAQTTATVIDVPRAPTNLSPPPSEPTRLPFQGEGSSRQAPGVSAESGAGAEKPAGVGPTVPPTQRQKPRPQPSSVRRKPERKPEASRPTAGSRAARQRPAAAGTAPASSQPVSPSGQPASVGATATPTPAGSKMLPPLPPALPYMRSATGTRVPGAIAPDKNGSVLARIPARGTVSGSAEQLPQAQPLTTTNPISGFIQEAFQKERPIPVVPRVDQRQPTQPAQPQSAPSSSVLGQLTHDVKQLGEGIKGVFQRMVPGQ